MKLIDQKQLHDPENGVTGDCFTAVLASMLELPLTFVPLFIEDKPEGEWVRKLNKWLFPFGLAYICLDPSFSLEYYGIKGLHHDVSGDSPRFPGINHACVGLDGKLVFDPHPTKLGLPKIDSFGVFIVLDPSCGPSMLRLYGLFALFSYMRRMHKEETGVEPTEVFMTEEVRAALEKDLHEGSWGWEDSLKFDEKFDGLIFRQYNGYGIVFK